MTSRCARPYYLFSFLFLFTITFLHSPALAQPKAPPGMIYIPKGYFQMGSSSGKEDEKPMHFVFTPGYFIDKYEVSNKNYAAFMLATEHQAPKFWNDSRFNEPDQPVVGVSWHDAMAY
ncbi:MAG: formylglycine-generating enzyme family protein, partial [Nitrospina sp.]|nr:formylglycine-generating enzyme family protein [Nitrospina sp.]